METLFIPRRTVETLKVFLIGNNPIELSNIYVKLKTIRNIKYNTEIGFDLPGIYERISKFKPDCIIIDDNIEHKYLKKLLYDLASGSKTKEIPVTMIKNKNCSHDSLSGAQEFILKENITPESLSNTITNAIRWRKMHNHFFEELKSRKSHFLNFF